MSKTDNELKTDTVVIGSGIVGLACAREIAQKGYQVVVLEKHGRSGEETSSRNSGVIHSGIYYPTGSKKATLCVEGNRLLYEYVKNRNIAYRNTGKIIVASTVDEVEKLERLFRKGLDNNVKHLSILSKREVIKYQPEIIAEQGLYCPSSGIVDVPELIQSLEAELQELGVIIAYNSIVEDIHIDSCSGFKLMVRGQENYSINAQRLVNSAGLHAVDLAKKMKEIPREIIPKAYYAKGHYFQLGGKHPFTDKLIYPLNEKDGLGIHVTLDISGKVRFGPDVTWIEEIDYSFDEDLRESFVEVIKTYWPNLNPEKLTPDYAGIRPKIYGPNDEPADFLIQTSKEHKISGLVNLLGIESPGLTSSFAVAREVVKNLF